MAKKIVFVIVLCYLFSGCAGNAFNPINPPAVSAQAPPPATCTDSGTCTANIQQGWAYFDYATYRSPHSIAVTAEIGISSNAPDANASIAAWPLASPADVVSISGNLDYRSWGNNPASMIIDIRACTDSVCSLSGQEHLVNLKVTADPHSHAVVPFAVQFPVAIHVDHFIAVFNDDLQNAKPTTVSVGLSAVVK